MTKIKEFIIKNKKQVLIIIGVLFVLIIALLIFLFLVNKGDRNEKKLENYLTEMGKDFYENYYYDRVGKTDDERKKFLKEYQSIGIKVDLDNLGRYNSKVNEEKIKEFINTDTNELCDNKKTRVIIYPKENFGKTDYDLEIELSCGYDTKKD